MAEDCMNVFREGIMFFRINQLIIILTLAAAVFMPHGLMAANSVDIEMTCDGQHDTIWVFDEAGNPVPSTFDILIENDVGLGGISLGFKIWTPRQAAWEYRDVSDSFALPISEINYLSVVPGSRLDPHNEIFDMTGLMVNEYSMDGLDHDTILIGGVSLFGELPPGPLQHMMSIHFKATTNEPICPSQLICIDSAFVPPAGNFVFTDAGGNTFIPEVLWEDGGKCWPVIDNYNYYFNNGKVIVEPDTIYARDAYSAEPETVTVTVGFSCYEAEDIIDSTVRIRDYDYSLAPLSMTSVDPITDYSNSALQMTFDMTDLILAYDNLFWAPTWRLINVTGAFYDGRYMGMDTYDHVLFIGLTPGDANGDDITNVGDVVKIVAYLERGGSVPVPWECADADGNGSVQMADAVYLINYIFRHGPPPTHP